MLPILPGGQRIPKPMVGLKLLTACTHARGEALFEAAKSAIIASFDGDRANLSAFDRL